MMGMYADFNYLYMQAYQIPRQQSVSSQTPIFFNSQREDKRYNISSGCPLSKTSHVITIH